MKIGREGIVQELLQDIKLLSLGRVVEQSWSSVGGAASLMMKAVVVVEADEASGFVLQHLISVFGVL